MATAAEIGATGSSYTGTPELGGYGLGFGKIDTRPLEDLARYTYFYNQAEWQQRQKDAEAAAAQLAKATAYDLTTGIPKDRDVLQQKYSALQTYLRRNPGAVQYKNTAEWQKFNEMKNDLENDITSAGVRNSMFKLRQNEIDDTTQPELKAYLQDKLDKEIEATDIRTPLRHSSKYDVAPVPIPDAPMRKFDVTDIGRNVIGEATWNLPDQRALNNIANVLSTGFANLTDFQNSPAYKQLPPQVQALVQDQYLAQRASGKLEPVLSAQNFNQAIQSLPQDQYFTTDPTGKKVVNLNALTNSNNGLISGIARQVQAYNNQMDQMTKYIKAGYFKDNFGNELHFGNDASGLDERDYKKIDLTDGLQPDELIKMQILGKSGTPSRTMKTTNTDNAIQAENLRARWAELGLQKQKLDQANTGSLVGANSVIQEVIDKINEAPGYTIKNPKSGRDDSVKLISDPDLIKEFDTIDKTGNVVNRADHIVFNPKTNQLTLVYYKDAPYKMVKDANDVTTKEFTDPSHVDINGKQINTEGRNIVEREVPLNATEWMGKIVNRKFSKDDAGPVNNLVDQVYSKFGRNLTSLVNGYRTNQAPQQEELPALSSYDASDQAGIKAFMIANKLDEKAAIKILRDKGYIK